MYQRNKGTMKKATYFLGILFIVLGGCGKTKHSFDHKTLPVMWTALNIEVPYYICDDAEKLAIDGDDLLYINRANDVEKYKIISSYQAGDTIVIETRIVDAIEGIDEFKIVWEDKDKGVAQWMFNSPMTGMIGHVNQRFVSDENLSKFPNIKCSIENTETENSTL